MSGLEMEFIEMVYAKYCDLFNLISLQKKLVR